MGERMEQTTFFGVEPTKTRADREREAELAREAFKKRLTEQLLTLAREALLDDEIRDGPGIPFYQIRHMAETRGYVRGDEPGDIMSVGSSIMRRAGARVVGSIISKHRNTKGRLVALWKKTTPTTGEVTG